MERIRGVSRRERYERLYRYITDSDQVSKSEYAYRLNLQNCLYRFKKAQQDVQSILADPALSVFQPKLGLLELELQEAGHALVRASRMPKLYGAASRTKYLDEGRKQLAGVELVIRFLTGKQEPPTANDEPDEEDAEEQEEADEQEL